MSDKFWALREVPVPQWWRMPSRVRRPSRGPDVGPRTCARRHLECNCVKTRRTSLMETMRFSSHWSRRPLKRPEQDRLHASESAPDMQTGNHVSHLSLSLSRNVRVIIVLSSLLLLGDCHLYFYIPSQLYIYLCPFCPHYLAFTTIYSARLSFCFSLFIFRLHIDTNTWITCTGGGIGHRYDDDDDDDRGGGVGLELMALLTARRRSVDL